MLVVRPDRFGASTVFLDHFNFFQPSRSVFELARAQALKAVEFAELVRRPPGFKALAVRSVCREPHGGRIWCRKDCLERLARKFERIPIFVDRGDLVHPIRGEGKVFVVQRKCEFVVR